MTVRAGTKHLIREINEALILDVVRLRGTVARAEIARATGLSPATITTITGRLVEAGLLAEVDRGPSTGGRPPKMLALEPGGAHVIGAWLTDTSLVAVTVDLLGDVVDHASVPLPDASPTAAVNALSEVVGDLTGRSASPIIGLGVTLSGVVDAETGTVRHSGLLGWEDVPLGDLLTAALGIEVAVDKLVNALASALVLFGDSRDSRTMMVVSAGHSIGCGLVIDGRVYHGSAGPTGSLGHTSVTVPAVGGKPCHCGARGCLDTVAGEWALRGELARVTDCDIDTAAARAADDPAIQRVFTAAGRALGGAVANVAKVIDPERIVLGGESTRLGPALLEPFGKELHRALAGSGDRDVEVQVVPTDERRWAHGAACQALAALFQVSWTPGRSWKP